MKRLIDRLIMLAWRISNIRGDPPRFVQSAFDREGIRLLREALP